jgi:hypothetical protein
MSFNDDINQNSATFSKAATFTKMWTWNTVDLTTIYMNFTPSFTRIFIFQIREDGNKTQPVFSHLNRNVKSPFPYSSPNTKLMEL